MTMQKFMWQVDMRSAVLCVRYRSFVLLDPSVATIANAASILTWPLVSRRATSSERLLLSWRV